LLVAEHLDQHRREAVDRVRDRPRPGREVGGEGVEGAVCQGMAVEEEELAHVLIVCPGPPARRGESPAPRPATPAVARLAWSERSLDLVPHGREHEEGKFYGDGAH